MVRPSRRHRLSLSVKSLALASRKPLPVKVEESLPGLLDHLLAEYLFH